jgi:hypothetical protein
MTGTDQGGRTPLHYAALANDTETVRQLLTQGASPNAADRQGFTPLHFAAQQRSLAAAEILLTAGAQADTANQYGNAPLAVAVMNSRGHGDLIQLLRRHDASPHHRNNAGQTPSAPPASSPTTTSPSSSPTSPAPASHRNARDRPGHAPVPLHRRHCRPSSSFTVTGQHRAVLRLPAPVPARSRRTPRHRFPPTPLRPAGAAEDPAGKRSFR